MGICLAPRRDCGVYHGTQYFPPVSPNTQKRPPRNTWKAATTG